MENRVLTNGIWYPVLAPSCLSCFLSALCESRHKMERQIEGVCSLEYQQLYGDQTPSHVVGYEIRRKDGTFNS